MKFNWNICCFQPVHEHDVLVYEHVLITNVNEGGWQSGEVVCASAPRTISPPTSFAAEIGVSPGVVLGQLQTVQHFPLYFQLINVISVSREQDVQLVADIRAAGHIEFNTKPRSHGDEHQKCSHAQLSQEAGRS